MQRNFLIGSETSRKWIKPLFVLFATICLSGVAFAAAENGAAADALARLRALAGDWEGTFEWTGARTDKGVMNATYYLTGNNSAVVENLTMGGVPTMTSVYHLDGADLRMTHYCGAQNQPRLRADRIDLAQGIVDFSFVDATNLSSPDAPHVHGLELRFVDSDHITVTFLFQSGRKESRERISLVRAKASNRGAKSSSSKNAIAPHGAPVGQPINCFMVPALSTPQCKAI